MELLNSSASESNVSQFPGVNPGDLRIVVSSVDSEHEVRLLGELDLATASQLQEELMRLTSDGATLVTVDLADLEFIDSTGLSVLITGLKRLRQQGGDMALRSPSPGTRKVLEITGLIEVFSVS
jgi:anti-sigma B factor antagonist